MINGGGIRISIFTAEGDDLGIFVDGPSEVGASLYFVFNPDPACIGNRIGCAIILTGRGIDDEEVKREAFARVIFVGKLPLDLCG